MFVSKNRRIEKEKVESTSFCKALGEKTWAFLNPYTNSCNHWDK